jgi:hypothetical protein
VIQLPERVGQVKTIEFNVQGARDLALVDNEDGVWVVVPPPLHEVVRLCDARLVVLLPGGQEGAREVELPRQERGRAVHPRGHKTCTVERNTEMTETKECCCNGHGYAKSGSGKVAVCPLHRAKTTTAHVEGRRKGRRHGHQEQPRTV